MASEHTLTLKAKLDASDVQQNIDKLNNSQPKSSNNDAKQTSNVLDSLGNSIKSLRQIIGGRVMVKTFLDFGKAANLLGENAEKTVLQLQQSANAILGAVASGNPAIIAFTAVMETMRYVASGLSRDLENAKKGLEELKERVKAYDELRDAGKSRQASISLQNLTNNGSYAQVGQALLAARQNRDKLLAARQEEMDKGATLGFDPEKVKKLDKDIADADRAVSQLEAAFGRLVDEQDEISESASNFKKKLAELSEAREAKYALQNKDTKYFEARRQEAQEGMQTAEQAGIADLYEKYYNDYQKATDALDQIWKKQAQDSTAQEKAIVELAKARMQWEDKEKDYIAAKKYDVTYFQNALAEAKRAMDNASTAEEFNAHAGRYTSLKSQMESITPKPSDYANILKMVFGDSMSEFSSQGFSMGETVDPTAGIERQIDQIIRLMQDQIRRDLQVVNTNNTL